MSKMSSPINLGDTLKRPVGQLAHLITSPVRLLNKPGLPPGTIHEREDAHPTRVFLYTYNEGGVEERELTHEEDLTKIMKTGNHIWIDIVGMANIPWIKKISETFGIHPLALEDAFERGQRPKVDFYKQTIYVLSQMIVEDESKRLEQVSFYVGQGYLISIQEKPGDVFDSVRGRLREGRGRIRKEGADYLLYALLDTLIDHYFLLIDSVEKEILDLEDRIINDPNGRVFHAIHHLRGQVRQIRRFFRPQRLMVEMLVKPPEEEQDLCLGEIARTYMRDCYDHAFLIADSLDNLAEQLSDLMDLYHSVVSNRMNEIMKVLTLVAAIFIPLTFIAGIYGMNFNPEVSKWNMPELNQPYGYPIALGAMFLTGLALVGYFRYKKWF